MANQGREAGFEPRARNLSGVRVEPTDTSVRHGEKTDETSKTHPSRHGDRPRAGGRVSTSRHPRERWRRAEPPELRHPVGAAEHRWGSTVLVRRELFGFDVGRAEHPALIEDGDDDAERWRAAPVGGLWIQPGLATAHHRVDRDGPPPSPPPRLEHLADLVTEGSHAAGGEEFTSRSFSARDRISGRLWRVAGRVWRRRLAAIIPGVSEGESAASGASRRRQRRQ